MFKSSFMSIIWNMSVTLITKHNKKAGKFIKNKNIHQEIIVWLSLVKIINPAVQEYVKARNRTTKLAIQTTQQTLMPISHSVPGKTRPELKKQASTLVATNLVF